MSIQRFPTGLLSGLVILLVMALASGALAATLASSTPAVVKTAQNLGPEDPSKVINLTFWLQVRNQAALDDLTRQMYTKGSPNFRKFLTREQYKEQFAPTDEAVQAVSDFAKGQGLQVLSVSKSNLAVRVSGTVGAVQNALNVQINRFQANGTSFHAPLGAPSIQGAAGQYVAGVGGLHDLKATSTAVHVAEAQSGTPYNYKTLTAQDRAKRGPSPFAKGTKTAGSNMFFNNQCWKPVETHGFTTNNFPPAAVYEGNRFGDEPGTPPPNLPPCGYEPFAMWTAYQMLPLFTAGGTGVGQTTVIVDAFDWPSLQADLATFAGIFIGVTPNLTIYQPQGPPPFNSGWGEEESLDLQWSLTMAPLANQALVEALDNSFTNLDNAVLFAVEAGLGGVVSNSYGAPEALVDPATLNAQNAIFQFAASIGISVHFSSGDSGDFLASDGVKTVSTGDDSPYATGVGGVSAFLNPDESLNFETGWGTQLTRLATSTNTPVIPPLHQGFIYGAGGGTSGFFAKPFYQGGLPGVWRKVPDVSWVADPYTGVAIIFSPCGDPSMCQGIGVIGGTSASCPMFSGLWTDVNQVLIDFIDGFPAGQAAPYMYFLPAGSLYDVISFRSPTNVAGSIFTGGPPQYQDPTQLMTPLDGDTYFPTAFYHSFTSFRWYDMGFGMDSSLHAAPGWDNVTGNGSPFGFNLVNGVISLLP